MSENIRLRTTPGGENKNINININQKFDFIEILSLKISQEDAYRRFCSEYGTIVGRVIVNQGIGVPNAKVSVFIPIDEVDKLDPEILGLYPYEVVTNKDSYGIPYNLLPNSNTGKDDCYTVVGTFPSKREIQDNGELSHIYCKYYKFSSTTNDSGDFMIFGVPVGEHFIHVDVDISDIGILSQKPYDSIKNGTDKNNFESNTKYKNRDKDPRPNQIKTVSPSSVSVIPFWGDSEQCNLGITRFDVDLGINITPSAIFMGSLMGDSDKHALNKKCRPRKKLGNMGEMTTGVGTIEMIRRTNGGGIENYTINGGNLIDEDGTWAFQVPMNLDYVITSEEGSLIPTKDGNKGIPTRGDYRFRIGMGISSEEGRLRTRAKHLIPHNPTKQSEVDYSFGPSTNKSSFTTLYWNKIYSIKNYISRVQPNKSVENKNFIGIKDVDEGDNNPYPFNKMDSNFNPLFLVICILVNIIANLIAVINSVLINTLNIVFTILNAVLSVICQVIKGIGVIVCLIPFTGKNCKNNFCIGCQDSGSCKCGEVLPYIPFITVKCDNKDYAPGGFAKPWPFKLGFEAAQKSIVSDDGDSGNADECYSPPEGAGISIIAAELPDSFLAGWPRCIATTLAEALNVFTFDFYNDWVNGNLYFFLFRYKLKKNGKDKFCDVDCGKSDSDNNCRRNFMLDSGTYAMPNGYKENTLKGNGVNTKGFVELRKGYIKKFDGNYYYAVFDDNTGFKMFATDMINLGSSSDFDWQGTPKIYNSLVSTTYNIPPLTDEIDDVTEEVDVSGFISPSPFPFGVDDKLIANISCFSVDTNQNSTSNIKRLCELSIGLDEDRTDEENGTPIDRKITNVDIENPFVRGLFTYVNSEDDNNGVVPLVLIDKNEYDYADENYNKFRGFTNNGVAVPIMQTANSYYFYFGLNAGKTALDKLKSNYFADCVREIKNQFYCVPLEIIEDSGDGDGSISINMVGGVEPFIYKWIGPTVIMDNVEVNYPLGDPDSDSISNLISGTYNAIVTDVNGNISDCTFIVPGPPSLFCSLDSTDTTQFNGGDGKVIISAQNGASPYMYNLYKVLDDGSNELIKNGTFNNTETVENLTSGVYEVEVTDTSSTVNSCTSISNIRQPEQLELTINYSDILCFNDLDGEAYAIITNSVNNPGSKGEYLWESIPAGYSSTAQSVSDLDGGQYKLTYTDDAGQTASGSFTIVKPPELILNVGEIKYSDKKGDDGYVVLIPMGGTPDYTLKIDGTDVSPDGGKFYIEGDTGTVKNNFTLIDSNNCDTNNNNYLVREPEDNLNTGNISVEDKLKIKYSNVNGSCTFNKETSPITQSLKIKVKDFKGGWGDTFTSYVQQPFKRAISPPDSLGIYNFILYYSDNNGATWVNTNVVESKEISTFNYSPLGYESEITVPDAFCRKNGSIAFGRQFRVELEDTSVVPSSTLPQYIPGINTVWCNGVVSIIDESEVPVPNGTTDSALCSVNMLIKTFSK